MISGIRERQTSNTCRIAVCCSTVNQPLTRNADDCYVSRRLGLALTRWNGVYGGVEATWIRWARLADGSLLPTLEEAAVQRADAEARRAEAEARRAEVETRRAEAETRRAEAAEAEVARLQALLAQR